MTDLISSFARLATASTLALFVLAIGRWPWIAARTPFGATALALALPLLGFAVTACLTGRQRAATRWRPVALALVVAALALAASVAARGPAGLAGVVMNPRGERLGTLPAAGLDLTGRDLRPFTGGRRAVVAWEGPLRVPEAGRYRLWVEGRRGRVSLSLDEHPMLGAEGDPLRVEVETALAAGTVNLELRFEQSAPGPRLRVGWVRPDGRRELLPRRYLGEPLPAWTWWLTDLLVALTAVLAGVLSWLAPWDVPRRLPSPPRLSWREPVMAAAGYALLLAVMSWPLVSDPVHAGPMDRTDGRLNAWILAWSGSVWTEPSRVFQAPAFHPLPDVLAFSENLLLPAALAAPFQHLGGPVLAYNVVFVGSLLLSGLGVFLLVRRAGGSALAAFVAGAFFAAGPHRWTRLAHLHAQVTVFLPFVLLAFDRFWEKRSLRRALVVGLLLALQGMCSIYLGAITAAALATAVGLAWIGGLRPREGLRLLAGLGVGALLLLPIVQPYLRMRSFQGQEWDPDTVAGFAATLPSYAAAGTPFWGWLTERLLDPATLRDSLFPGVTVLVLGVAGLASAPRRFRAVALAASFVAVVFSLGPETALYRLLSDHLVLVRGVRALARFALVPTLALAVLAGLALSGRRRAVVIAAGLAMMVESASLPLRLVRYEGPTPAARWLGAQPGAGALLALPLAEDDTHAMLDNLAHHKPLVNGYSAFIPRPFSRAMELFATGLDEEGLRFLRGVGVTHVVSASPLPWPAVAVYPGQYVIEVPPGPSARPITAGQAVATRWTVHGVQLTLPEGRRVGRVVFDLSDAEWLAQPRVEASLDGEDWVTLDATASLADATLSLYRAPRQGRGEVRFTPVGARWLRLDPRLPARPGVFEVGESSSGD